MFEFVGRPLPMLACLDGYIQAPEWDHALDIVPMAVAAPPPMWPHWQPDTLRDEGLQTHLLRALRHWSAFRPLGSERRTTAEAALCERLPEFIADVQALPNAQLHLSEVPDDDIWPLAQALEARLSRFGREVKGQGSCVLPSKTAHLLLPGFVPAYDIGVIVNTTMVNLIQDTNSMTGYLCLCWWVLRRFREEGTLQQARDRVADHLMSDWALRALLPTDAILNHWLLRSMDSVVAEYTLIQMARTVGAADDYLLQWAE
jgi:hypothetical protein